MNLLHLTGFFHSQGKTCHPHRTGLSSSFMSDGRIIRGPAGLWQSVLAYFGVMYYNV